MNEFGIETRVGERGITLFAGGDPLDSGSEILATQYGLKAARRLLRATKSLNIDFFPEAFLTLHCVAHG